MAIIYAYGTGAFPYYVYPGLVTTEVVFSYAASTMATGWMDYISGNIPGMSVDFSASSNGGNVTLGGTCPAIGSYSANYVVNVQPNGETQVYSYPITVSLTVIAPFALQQGSVSASIPNDIGYQNVQVGYTGGPPFAYQCISGACGIFANVEWDNTENGQIRMAIGTGSSYPNQSFSCVIEFEATPDQKQLLTVNLTTGSAAPPPTISYTVVPNPVQTGQPYTTSRDILNASSAVLSWTGPDGGNSGLATYGHLWIKNGGRRPIHLYFVLHHVSRDPLQCNPPPFL